MRYLIFSLLLVSPLSTLAQDVADATAAEGPGASSLIIQLLIIFGIFYFLIIRPQQKKMKEHQGMTSGLSKGDKVITQGGIAGVVTDAKGGDKFIEVEIAAGVRVNVLRATVSEKLPAEVKVKVAATSDKSEDKEKKSGKSKGKSKK